MFLRVDKSNLELASKHFCNLRLDRKHILQLSIIVPRPEVTLTRSVNELRSNSHLVTRLPNTAFDQGPGTQFSSYIPCSLLRPLVGHHRCPRDNSQLLNSGKRGDHLLRHTIRKISLHRIRAQIRKWQNSNTMSIKNNGALRLGLLAFS